MNSITAVHQSRSAATEARLKARGFKSRIHVRAGRNRPLSQAQEAANRKKSKIRARIEHVFGAQETAPGGRIVRTIGLVRARAKIGLANLVYNIRRLVTLERMAADHLALVERLESEGADVLRPHIEESTRALLES